jgi:hypothetical protein
LNSFKLHIINHGIESVKDASFVLFRMLSRRLYLKTSSAVYENHLLDARIDGSQAGAQLPLPWVWALQQGCQKFISY